jgi:hypothetical protein
VGAKRAAKIRWRVAGIVAALPIPPYPVDAEGTHFDAVLLLLDHAVFKPVERQPGGLLMQPDPEFAAKLQITIDKTTGRATWIGLECAEGLRPSDLQRFPWSTTFAMADAAERGVDDPHSAQGFYIERTMQTPAGATFPKAPRISKRPGRKGHSDEHYVAVAERYRQLRAQGSTSPTATIAKERKVSRHTVAGWVREARDREYLPPARPGRAG